MDADGTLLVADVDAIDGEGAVIRVDPTTGNQTIVSSGGFFHDPGGIAIAPDGRVFVTQGTPGQQGVFEVDATTGAQTIISSGQFFANPFGIAVESTGHLVVTDHEAFGGPGGIIRIDPATGAQTVLSAGGFFNTPLGIAVEPAGTLLVTHFTSNAVIRVNQLTGNQTLLASGGVLNGPVGIVIRGTAIFVNSQIDGTTVRVDTQQVVASGFAGPTGLAAAPAVGPPTTRSQCENGGWQLFDTPRTFKNQGDCIRFTAAGK